jgi:mono/diheme cytochrome c family protein
LSDDWVVADAANPELERGRYLVEALGHCGECHTPRNILGGLDKSRWLTGAKNPNGEGRIPDITPTKLSWSASDIAYYFETGFKPDFDTAGGHMVEVVENLAGLPTEDRQAIAAYLKALP